MSPRPAYADLPDHRSAGVFGPADTFGTLNLQTEQAVAHGASLVRRGAVFSLNASLAWPDPPLFDRAPLQHTVFRTALGNLDDYVDSLYPQSSSQWDGFLHIRDPESGFYNGLGIDELGIQSWAERGIAGRGVLVDFPRHLAARGEQVDWRALRRFTAGELLEVLNERGVERREGDILLVRTGWTAGYDAAAQVERDEVRTDRTSPGLDDSVEMAELLWDWGVSAVASDNIGLEAMPVDQSRGSLHAKLLCRLGMPLGELWHLEELAADCAADGVDEFFLTSAPLNLPGGIGSPANALALK